MQLDLLWSSGNRCWLVYFSSIAKNTYCIKIPRFTWPTLIQIGCLFNFSYFLSLGEEAPIPKGGVKPTFTERPVIRQSDDESNKIIFECRLVGEPRPDVTWYHNEKQIVETDRHKYSMELDAKLYYLCRFVVCLFWLSAIALHKCCFF